MRLSERTLMVRTTGSFMVQGHEVEWHPGNSVARSGRSVEALAGLLRGQGTDPRWIIASSFFPETPQSRRQVASHVATSCGKR